MDIPIEVNRNRVIYTGEEFVGDGQTHVLKRTREVRDFGHWRFTNCYFRGVHMQLSMAGAKKPNGTVDSLGTGLTHDVLFDGCVFEDCLSWATLLMAGVQHITIRDCTFLNCGNGPESGDSIKACYGTRYMHVLGGSIEDAARDGVDLYDSSDCTVDGVFISRCGALGIDAKQLPKSVNKPTRHTVRNCIVGDCEEAGISVAVDYACITGNRVYRCQDGIRNGSTTDRCKHGIITGNFAHDCRRYGIYAAGQGTILHDNIATGNEVGDIFDNTIPT